MSETNIVNDTSIVNDSSSHDEGSVNDRCEKDEEVSHNPKPGTLPEFPAVDKEHRSLDASELNKSDRIIGPIEMIVDKFIQLLNRFINELESDTNRDIKQFALIYALCFVVAQILLRIQKKICENILYFLAEGRMLIISVVLASLLTFLVNSDYMQTYLKRKFLFLKKNEIVPDTSSVNSSN
jgi:hypothetical protein